MSAARSRLEHAISEGQLLSSLDNASSIRDLLGQQDLQAKTFLKNLTRFHRLKQRLDALLGLYTRWRHGQRHGATRGQHEKISKQQRTEIPP